MVSFCCEIFLLCAAALMLTFFIAGLLFICASSTSITCERTPHPVRRPAFSSHLVTSVIGVIASSRDRLCPWPIRRMLRFHLEDGTPIVGLHPFRFGVEAYVFFRVGEPRVNSKSKMLHFQQ